MQRAVRMKREIEMFTQQPPFGVSCWPKDEADITNLEAQILGGEDTPYEGGIFKLEIQVPERYPFEPPKVRFLTPIYHPNIDTAGRICLDSLKMPPKGAWKPSLNLSTLLTTVQLLMAEPNPDDPLMTDIAEQYKYKRPEFVEAAKQWTRKHAMPDKIVEEPATSSDLQTKPVNSEQDGTSTAKKRPSDSANGVDEKKLCT